MSVDGILDLLGTLKVEAKAQTEEIYWFFELIDHDKKLARLVEEGAIIDFTITSESEPFMGLFHYHVTPLPAVEQPKIDAAMLERNYPNADL